MSERRKTAIAESEVSTLKDTVTLYERQTGTLTRDVGIGLDPLADRPDLV